MGDHAVKQHPKMQTKNKHLKLRFLCTQNISLFCNTLTTSHMFLTTGKCAQYCTNYHISVNANITVSSNQFSSWPSSSL